MTERRRSPLPVRILLAATALLALALPTAAAEAASVTVSGTVRCTTGAPVVGIWVQSSGGGSKFASRWAMPGRASVNGYSATVNSGSVELHVGCGGTTSKWGSDQWTPKATVSASRKLNASCSGATGTFRRVTCSFPARPNLTAPATNTFTPKNCTWYAAEKWRSATGKYPSWSGNAKDWNNHAAPQGWTVTVAPAPRSVVVFEPGVQGASGTNGHVAWVNSVSYRSDGWYLNVSEMNFTGTGVISSRTVKHVSGMNYIWAPG